MINLLRRYQREVVLIIIAFSAYALLDIALPLSIGIIPRYINKIQNHLTSSQILLLILAFAFFIVARHSLIYLFSKIGFKTIFNVYESASNKSLVAKLKTVSSLDFSSGDLQKATSTDIEFIVGGMVIPASTIFVESLILFVSIVLFVNAIGLRKFALLAVPFALAVAVILYWQILKNKKLGNARNKFVGAKLKVIAYIESLAYEILSYDAISYASNLFKQANKNVANVSFNQSVALVQGRINLESSYGILLITFLIFIFGSSSNDQQGTFFVDDTFVLAFALSIRLIPGVGRLIQSSQSVSYVWPTVSYLLRSLKNDSLGSQYPLLNGSVFIGSSNSLITIPTGELSVEGNCLFKIHNLTIPNQGIVTIYGESGAGKSSFLLSLYKILIERSSLQVSYMRQNTPPPMGSIYEYISLSKNHNRSRIDRLMRSLKLDALIPSSDHDLVNEYDRPLSGGQIQRLALARALYHNARVILLDEFTSALDNSTQDSIMQWLKNYVEDSSISVVCTSHRQALKQYSDMVLSIDNGNLCQTYN